MINRELLEGARLLEQARGISGATSDSELEFLALLASRVPSDNIVVEIGTMHGRSAVALSAGAPGRVYSIEYNPRPPLPPDGIFYFIAESSLNVSLNWKASRDFSGCILPLMFKEMAEHTSLSIFTTDPVGLLFLDDDHISGVTIVTINDWLSLMADNAVLALHDNHMTEVQCVINTLSDNFLFEEKFELISVFRRKSNGN